MACSTTVAVAQSLQHGMVGQSVNNYSEKDLKGHGLTNIPEFVWIHREKPQRTSK
jgi:hypothetical protein